MKVSLSGLAMNPATTPSGKSAAQPPPLGGNLSNAMGALAGSGAGGGGAAGPAPGASDCFSSAAGGFFSPAQHAAAMNAMSGGPGMGGPGGGAAGAPAAGTAALLAAGIPGGSAGGGPAGGWAAMTGTAGLPAHVQLHPSQQLDIQARGNRVAAFARMQGGPAAGGGMLPPGLGPDVTGSSIGRGALSSNMPGGGHLSQLSPHLARALYGMDPSGMSGQIPGGAGGPGAVLLDDNPGLMPGSVGGGPGLDRDPAQSVKRYRDYSRVPPDDEPQANSSKGSNSSTAKNFPMKLHEILSRDDVSDIIAWAPHGRSWRVLKPKAFEEKIIPQYFRHGKYNSFTRQVNGWGFRRITQGPDHNSYYHEFFLRGLPHLCKKMRRLTATGLARADACTRIEPDFYRISKVSPLPPGPSSSSAATTVAGAGKQVDNDNSSVTKDHVLNSPGSKSTSSELEKPITSKELSPKFPSESEKDTPTNPLKDSPVRRDVTILGGPMAEASRDPLGLPGAADVLNARSGFQGLTQAGGMDPLSQSSGLGLANFGGLGPASAGYGGGGAGGGSGLIALGGGGAGGGGAGGGLPTQSYINSIILQAQQQGGEASYLKAAPGSAGAAGGGGNSAAYMQLLSALQQQAGGDSSPSMQQPQILLNGGGGGPGGSGPGMPQQLSLAQPPSPSSGGAGGQSANLQQQLLSSLSYKGGGMVGGNPASALGGGVSSASQGGGASLAGGPYAGLFAAGPGTEGALSHHALGIAGGGPSGATIVDSNSMAAQSFLRSMADPRRQY